ncbi:two-component system histidine kinase PnpS [Geobacter sp. AOG1]|uniref:two-component system histidine kinase PnpS n=1 Tax=Geobacter sp. AOG1 TaxID=1566346 RepID=UPI001CC76FCE|nr:ATP-binding protein [Geobacter sp. AOG1]GFE57944.1 PAS domain-containing sensor histidine kinase [Geobacter sp. AOG1]
MKIRMQWKLMASYLLLVLLMGGALYAYLNHSLTDYLVNGIRDNLFNEARLARLTATRHGGNLQDAPALADAIGKEIKARVTVIATDGRVIGDSEVKAADLAGLENHLQRPEIQQALTTGNGSAIRYSSTLRTSMLYVALPIQTEGKTTAVLRLALPLAALDKTRENLHTMLGAALAVAIMLSLFFSYILSRVTSHSLRAMTASAARIGKGEFGRRIPVRTRDELGELAQVMNDMSERIKGQLERLAAEKTRLDTILRGMGEGLMVTDAEGVVTLVNPAFRTLFAIGEEVEGKQLIAITRHPGLHEAYRKVLATGNERIEELTIQLGGEKTLLTHWVPLQDEEMLLGVVAVFHDISDLKLLEKIRRDFVANVSHELRTPVTVIKGYAETLLEGGLATDQERSSRFLRIIYNHAERLAALIGDLLTLSELESGDLSLEVSQVNLESTVSSVIALLGQSAEQKGITITCSDLKGMTKALADRGRLEQVLINLLDNAIKYTPERGTITIDGTREGDMVKISIADTGVGIPSQDIPRIFERFYRVDSARSRDQGGTGLGLSIVKHIVQLHGGTIVVTSTPGRGSVFSFTLRAA